MTTVTTSKNEKGVLKKTLSIWEAIGISVALMAPSVAINIAPQGSAGIVGIAVPLTFVLATVGVLFVSYTFVRLSQRFHHAGSLYGFVGATIGAGAGVFVGWALVAVYILWAVITVAAGGHFFLAALKTLGLLNSNLSDFWGYPIGLIVILELVWLVASRSVRFAGRTVLYVEIATITLISIVAGVTLIKLLTGHAGAGKGFSLSVFSFPKGVPTSSLFLGAVFGFLAFAGFEAAATLGEETANPRRNIPRAILGTALFGGVFFTLATAIAVNGFGTDAAGVKAFTNSGSIFGDLGTQYIGSSVGALITLGAAVGGFSAALASVISASRLLYALSRDGIGFKSLDHVSHESGVPSRAINATVGATAVVILAGAIILKLDPFTAFATFGATGVLILLVGYALATVGAIKLLFLSGEKTVKTWEVTIPVLGLAVIGYTLFRNAWPLPTGSAVTGPAIAVGWLVLELILLVTRRKATVQAGIQLTQDEGLKADASHARQSN